MSEKLVAQVLIQPRVFERQMTEADNEAVDDLVRGFHDGMRGKALVVAAQALGILTADYCKQISDRGGESICALQDIAGRGQDFLRADVVAREVVRNAGIRMTKRRGKRKVT